MSGHTTADPRTDQFKRHNYIRAQWQLLGISLAVLALLWGYQQFREHRSITIHEQQQLLTQSRVISRNIEHQLDATNLALKGVIEFKSDMAVSCQ